MNNSRRTYAVIVIILLGLVIGLIGCTKAPFGPIIQPFQFPMSVGNRWDFVQVDIYSQYDTASILTSTDTAYGNSTTVVSSYGFLPDSSRQVYTFFTEWATEYSDGWRSSHYDNHPDGFYYYGGSPDIWTGPPKLNPGDVVYEFKGFRASSLDELIRVIQSNTHTRASRTLSVLDLEEPPVRELAYPLKTGSRWVYRDTTLGHLLNMEKEVVGTERITVPAGKFNCFKIRWYWDTDHDGQWDTDIERYDYISEIGTVRRQFMFYNIVMRDYELKVIGYYNVISDYSLTDYALR